MLNRELSVELKIWCVWSFPDSASWCGDTEEVLCVKCLRDEQRILRVPGTVTVDFTSLCRVPDDIRPFPQTGRPALSIP